MTVEVLHVEPYSALSGSRQSAVKPCETVWYPADDNEASSDSQWSRPRVSTCTTMSTSSTCSAGVDPVVLDVDDVGMHRLDVVEQPRK